MEPAVGALLASEQLDERGLARAVHAHQRHAVAALDGEARAAKHMLRAVALRQALRLSHGAPRGRRLGKLEVNDGLGFGNLDALDLFQFLDARLHLLGLGGLVAEAVDEGLKVLDALALVAVSGHQLLAPLVFLREVFCVIALVDGEALVPYLHGAVDGHVEKVAVVRAKDVAEGIVSEIILEPVAGFQIQMICGLVQKQKIRLGEQQLGQRNAHLPAAREFIGLPRPVFLAEAKAGEHAAHLRVERVTVERVKAVLQQRVALGGGVVLRAFVVQFRQLRGQPLDFALHLVQLVEDGEAFLEHRAAGKLQSLLRQVADADAARLLEGAVVQRFQSGEHLHQRGFTRAVGAHQRGLFVVADEPVGLKKQHPRAEPLAGILERKHESLFSQRPLARLCCLLAKRGHGGTRFLHVHP